MGRTHRVETTFPRLGEPLGYVPKEDILYAIKAIIVTQRENGRRDDRKYSRMKYLISAWGNEKFRSVVEQYYGKKFEAFGELPELEFKSCLGWHEQGDGAMFCGLHIDSGRIGVKMKKKRCFILHSEKYDLTIHLAFRKVSKMLVWFRNRRCGSRRCCKISMLYSFDQHFFCLPITYFFDYLMSLVCKYMICQKKNCKLNDLAIVK